MKLKGALPRNAFLLTRLVNSADRKHLPITGHHKTEQNENALFVSIVVISNLVFDKNCDITATADFRSGQSLSAGNASASSEETHFLRDLQLLLFPLESTALRSNQSAS
ncbi:hypothetical protein [Oceanobacillus massiliensis]|uniref:hypothetical protein n=1 Tax=Oceanobacillus massiliensis TaxID=1465765 RepID=UPI0002899EFF|nr:hypothetical protein [Oceanobacillus massiliensis]